MLTSERLNDHAHLQLCSQQHCVCTADEVCDLKCPYMLALLMLSCMKCPACVFTQLHHVSINITQKGALQEQASAAISFGGICPQFPTFILVFCRGGKSGGGGGDEEEEEEDE